MAMTQDEIRDFWKLGASLRKVLKDSADPSVMMARAAYEELKAKMIEQISKQGEEDQESLEIKDAKMATTYLDAVLAAFISLVSMIPQLAGDPKTAEVIDNGKAASKWLHENVDSLNNPEK